MNLELDGSMRYLSYTSGKWEESCSDVIVEWPIALSVNNEVWLTFMCTPVDLEALAVGFLFNEGIIQSMEEVVTLRVCPSRDNIDVWLTHAVEKPKRWVRTSGCTGGETSVAENMVERNNIRSTNGGLLSAEQIGNLITRLLESQGLYRKSGGVHTSALSDGEKITLVAEDIGRHNTLDKIAGRCLMEKVDQPRQIILTTGRISSEMIQKAGRIGVTFVISRTSPSSLSIQMAERVGITLIGYARRDRCKVYTHAERILSTPFKEGIKSEEK
jgi:FdhD protein